MIEAMDDSRVIVGTTVKVYRLDEKEEFVGDAQVIRGFAGDDNYRRLQLALPDEVQLNLYYVPEKKGWCLLSIDPGAVEWAAVEGSPSFHLYMETGWAPSIDMEEVLLAHIDTLRDQAQVDTFRRFLETLPEGQTRKRLESSLGGARTP